MSLVDEEVSMGNTRSLVSVLGVVVGMVLGMVVVFMSLVSTAAARDKTIHSNERSVGADSAREAEVELAAQLPDVEQADSGSDENHGDVADAPRPDQADGTEVGRDRSRYTWLWLPRAIPGRAPLHPQGSLCRDALRPLRLRALRRPGPRDSGFLQRRRDHRPLSLGVLRDPALVSMSAPVSCGTTSWTRAPAFTLGPATAAPTRT